MSVIVGTTPPVQVDVEVQFQDCVEVIAVIYDTVIDVILFHV